MNFSFQIHNSQITKEDKKIEENHEFAINTINRHKTRLKVEAKIGELTYTFRRYKKLSRISDFNQ
jgi:hypothetical protein